MESLRDDEGLLQFMRGIGWYPDRRVDLQADLEAWAVCGYHAPDAVLRWMEECGGLKFEYPRHAAAGGMHTCVVSGVISARRIARALVAEYEEKAGCDLCPIGQSASGGLFLLMDAAGHAYGGHDHFIAKVADDGYRALLAIWKRDQIEWSLRLLNSAGI